MQNHNTSDCTSQYVRVYSKLNIHNSRFDCRQVNTWVSEESEYDLDLILFSVIYAWFTFTYTVYVSRDSRHQMYRRRMGKPIQ